MIRWEKYVELRLTIVITSLKSSINFVNRWINTKNVKRSRVTQFSKSTKLDVWRLNEFTVVFVRDCDCEVAHRQTAKASVVRENF